MDFEREDISGWTLQASPQWPRLLAESLQLGCSCLSPEQTTLELNYTDEQVPDDDYKKMISELSGLS